jgi:hypothetical protein
MRQIVRRLAGRHGSGSLSAGGECAPGGLTFDDAELEASLVWIWGSPRSGSTWLLRQLCHPARLSARFPVGFAPPPAWRNPLDAVPVDEFLVSRHIAPPSGAPLEVGDTYVPATLNNYVGAFPGYVFSDSYEDVWKPEVRRLVLVRLNAVLERARREGILLDTSPAIVIKEVNGSHAADLVMSIFPRSRMLFLLRDGRDVLDSRIHAHAEGGWLAADEGPRFRSADERLRWVRDAAREWACSMDATRRAYDHHEPALRRSVRYEDLLRDNADVLRPLLAWLGLDRDPERLAQIVTDTSFDAMPADRRGDAEPYRAATPGLWRENLTAVERDAVNVIMGARLDALGYGRAEWKGGGS